MVIQFVDNLGKKAKLELSVKAGKFSCTGEYDKSMGQCYHDIKPRTEAQKELLELCVNWHLNDMNAGTEKQTKVLEKCTETDYSKRVEFLKAHDIDGNPLTVTMYNQIKLYSEGAKTLIDYNKSLLQEIEDFLEEYKKAKHGWNRTKFERIVKVLKGEFLSSDFVFEESKEQFVPNDCRYFIESPYARYNNRLKAGAQRRLTEYKKGLVKELQEQQELYKSWLLKCALYDLHPTTGEVYQYGCGWLTRELPANFEETLKDLCNTIEEEEEERTSESTKVVDISELEEEDETRDLIIESAIDENAQALALFLDLTVEEMEEIEEARFGYGSCLYEVQGQEYYCGTEEEIKEAVKEYINNTAWAFNSSFLASETDMPEQVFTAMQGECEDSNEAVISIIERTCGLDSFVDSALSADGFGHFLNSWDGTKNEQEYNQTTYFICRA